MAIEFRSIPRKNPRDLTAPPKFYAVKVNQGDSDIDRLAALISDGSTVRQADVYAVIVSLMNAIQGELREGRIVRLGKLGSLSISISSEGAETEEQVSAAMIRSSKIRYRPSQELKDMLATLRYTKSSQ